MFDLKRDDVVVMLTCSSFSAVGLFFGFLVRANLTKWWKLFVLFRRTKDEDTKKGRERG